MEKFQFFWDTMALCDWDAEGDDELVLKPVVQFLAAQKDADIFKFDDLLAELLYQLDTKKLAEQCGERSGFLSDDGFLYSRCVALINGADYYEKARRGEIPEMWDMEFEVLIYVPQMAWEAKYGETAEAYPHCTPLSFETGSNAEGWQ